VRDRLADLRALTEASLDFDERDTGHVPDDEIEAGLAAARALLGEALDFEVARTSPLGEPTVVLAGAPNAGKSSLFNRLAGEEGAIVSPIPGTTRDALSARIPHRSGAFRLVDTAGLSEARSGVERAARGLTERALEGADLVVWVVDARSGDPGGSSGLVAWNKVDLPGLRPPPKGSVATSAVTGEGLGELREAIAGALFGSGGEAGGVSRDIAQRHRRALADAAAALDQAFSARRERAPLEIQAEHLRSSCEALDAITGSTASEDVLDRIFARFCLGK
jgi:tRNA modification GTPase